VTGSGGLSIEGLPDAMIERFHLDRLPLERASVGAGDLLRLDGRCALVTGGGYAGDERAAGGIAGESVYSPRTRSHW
jgi:hypothetical protein